MDAFLEFITEHPFAWVAVCFFSTVAVCGSLLWWLVSWLEGE